MKKLLKVLLWLVAIIVVIILALPLWIGPVVRIAANSIVPSKTQTAFNLGKFSLNPYTGRLEVGKVQLDNPEGYKPQEAFVLGDFVVDMDMGSVFTDTIVVEEILIKNVFTSYVSKDGKNNFDVIAKNAMGDEKPVEESKSKVEVEVKKDQVSAKGEAAKEAKAKEEKPKAEEKKSQKKFIIDRIQIEGVKVYLGFMPIPLPPITLTGIGRSTGGATWDEVCQSVSSQFDKAFKQIGVDFDKLSALTGDATKAMGEASAKATKALGDATESSKKALNDATESSKKMLGNATESTTKALSGATSKTTETLGNAASSTTKAVGDTATKAMDGATKALDDAGSAIKGLFGK